MGVGDRKDHMQEVLFYAETAYKAQRFDDMHQFTKQALSQHKRLNQNVKGDDLNLREKALFTKCYKLNYDIRFKGWLKMDKEFIVQENKDENEETLSNLKCIR